MSKRVRPTSQSRPLFPTLEAGWGSTQRRIFAAPVGLSGEAAEDFSEKINFIDQVKWVTHWPRLASRSPVPGAISHHQASWPEPRWTDHSRHAVQNGLIALRRSASPKGCTREATVRSKHFPGEASSDKDSACSSTNYI